MMHSLAIATALVATIVTNPVVASPWRLLLPLTLTRESITLPLSEGRDSEVLQSVTISGRVTGTDGAVIEGATVTAEFPAGRRVTTTDAQGYYRLEVPLGPYRLKVELAGLKPVVRDGLEAGLGRDSNVDIRIPTGSMTEPPKAGVIEDLNKIGGVILTPPPPPANSSGWWNTWITRAGAAELSPESMLKTDSRYTLFLELSSLNRNNVLAGLDSAPLDSALAERLRQLLAQGIAESSLVVRFDTVGRSAVLANVPNRISAWNSGSWIPGNSGSSIDFNVHIASLFPAASTRPPEDGVPRAGAVRVTLDTKGPGCSAVVIGIWDQDRRIPLDHIVRFVEVGNVRCPGRFDTRPLSVNTLYPTTGRTIIPDAALQVFEYTLNGKKHTSSMMSLAERDPQCEFFSWSSDASVTDLILKNQGFKDLLYDARNIPGRYAAVARRLSATVFPDKEGVGRCGSGDAFRALVKRTSVSDVKLYTRLTDEDGNLGMLPIGLIGMLDSPVFAHDIRVFAPLQRETFESTDCVSGWTFVLPSQLEGLPDGVTRPQPPVWTKTDPRVLHSRDEFVRGWLRLPDSPVPAGVVLLAHHSAGTLTFADESDEVIFTEFNRRVGGGTIAILSACETGNLSGEMGIINRLNENGADAIVGAAFEFPAEFGAYFAYAFADIVGGAQGSDVTVLDAFESALRQTTAQLVPTMSSRARGASLELVLAGNPNLRICVPRRDASSVR